jgi:hypothetical protein
MESTRIVIPRALVLTLASLVPGRDGQLMCVVCWKDVFCVYVKDVWYWS